MSVSNSFYESQVYVRNWNTDELMAAELIYFVYDRAFTPFDFGLPILLVAWQLRSIEAE